MNIVHGQNDCEEVKWKMNYIYQEKLSGMMEDSFEIDGFFRAWKESINFNWNPMKNRNVHCELRNRCDLTKLGYTERKHWLWNTPSIHSIFRLLIMWKVPSSFVAHPRSITTFSKNRASLTILFQILINYTPSYLFLEE